MRKKQEEKKRINMIISYMLQKGDGVSKKKEIRVERSSHLILSAHFQLCMSAQSSSTTHETTVR